MIEGEILEKVKKRLVRKSGIVFLATTDRKGTPHIAASEGMTFTEDGKALFKAWFCLKTVENLSENGKLFPAILNPKTKEGYQILGEIERIDRVLFWMDTDRTMRRNGRGTPRPEHRLLIRVQKVASLTSGPHSDEFI